MQWSAYYLKYSPDENMKKIKLAFGILKEEISFSAWKKCRRDKSTHQIFQLKIPMALWLCLKGKQF